MKVLRGMSVHGKRPEVDGAAVFDVDQTKRRLRTFFSRR
jgi:hypothetical protein